MKTSHRILVFPAWRDNPYLNILSLAPRAAGYEFREATRYESLIEQLEQLSGGDVLHIHWTSPLVQDAQSRDLAEERLASLDEHLSTAAVRGVQVIWTIHNRLPHELKYRQEELALYRLLSKRATVVHVMNPATRETLADVCDIDAAKIKIIPHPTYAGIYQAPPSKTAARASFGIDPDETAVLFLGQIRPYKGIDLLIDAIANASHSSTTKPVLLLAGTPKETPPEDIEALVPDGVRAILHLDFVDDADIPRWFAAADLTVLPYRAILNSGSVHLAATFGVPAILPDEPHVRAQYEDEPWVRLYDPAAGAGGIAELIADRHYLDQLSLDDFRDFLAGVNPWRISNAYLDLLAALSDRSLVASGA